MKFHKKHWNSLWVAIFCCYWLFLFLLFIFQKQEWTKTIREAKYTFWMIPANYSMYTSPPKENLLIYYQFYNDNMKIGEIEIQDYFNEKFSDNSFKTSIIKDRYLYYMFPRGAFQPITNSYFHYQFYLGKEIDEGISFKSFLKESRNKEYLLARNQLLFSKELLKKDNYLHEADKLILTFVKESFHISLADDKEFRYLIKKDNSVILEMCKELK